MQKLGKFKFRAVRIHTFRIFTHFSGKHQKQAAIWPHVFLFFAIFRRRSFGDVTPHVLGAVNSRRCLPLRADAHQATRACALGVQPTALACPRCAQRCFGAPLMDWRAIVILMCCLCPCAAHVDTTASRRCVTGRPAHLHRRHAWRRASRAE